MRVAGLAPARATQPPYLVEDLLETSPRVLAACYRIRSADDAVSERRQACLDRCASSSIGPDARPWAGVVVVRRARRVTARAQTAIVMNEIRETGADLLLTCGEIWRGRSVGLARPP